MNAMQRKRGFTLIEVMIVVAIVAILSAIAYPSYQDSVRRSRRADAKAVLLETAQWIERQYTISNRYDKKGDLTDLDNAALPYTEAPKEGASKYYDISFTGTHDDKVYTLRAVPKNGMTGDMCGTFTLTHTGLKGVSSSDVATCWNR